MSMPAPTREFSDETLHELLRALYARTSTHPENPGLIASWPSVREERMAAAEDRSVVAVRPVQTVKPDNVKLQVARSAVSSLVSKESK